MLFNQVFKSRWNVFNFSNTSVGKIVFLRVYSHFGPLKGVASKIPTPGLNMTTLFYHKIIFYSKNE